MRDIGESLTGVVEEIDAPGAVVAVAADGEVHEFAAGIANIDTGAEMTPDTLFPIASITKVFTATLVMQLVDEGRVDLDSPVRDYLPDFRVADEQASRTVTVRHLLTHTSGIDGDKFDTFGRGDDALARYVADCATLGQSYPPGATYSYCNSGFNILGHLVAVLRGQTWDDAIREGIFEPLGMRYSGTLPEDVIWRRVAAGHQRGDDGRPELLAVWEAERSHGPAGGVVTSARELLDFAAAFSGAGDAHLLSDESVQAMTSPQLELPNPSEGETHQGLGWALARYPGQPALHGHGGDLLAHHALLVACPERNFAAVVLTNGDGRDRVERQVLHPLLADIGVHYPEPPQPPPTPPDVDLAALSGIYETPAVRLTIRPDDQHLGATLRVIDERMAALLPQSQRERRLDLLPVTPELFVTRFDPDEPWTPAVFASSAGQFYLHMGARAIRRVGEPA